ncbi:hypothetical protein DRW41_17215 [Neobacillus piezotolerans]|uniref:Uncharacterized protein n=1 Tax=Neobacillus piezotolerans TaxID=2259171 RepID=A0A3D8GLX9_9BACI|nr:hypothetical protein [Neobacillus piezotolerans]RDU35480.1 hypothetical protein DRW41_17215 [Neobacillus piezotolerans]
MSIEVAINELTQESQEINRKLETLKFLKENRFESLLSETDELELTTNRLIEKIDEVIQKQIDKNPKEMDERLRQVWFASTNSKLIIIKKKIDDLISEISKL